MSFFWDSVVALSTTVAEYVAAACAARYHLGLDCHHNMHLEALHRVLKHVHMGGRKVRQMDRCIHALLRLMRSKTHDRLMKVHKSKWTRHLLGIRNRHKKAISCNASLITVIQPEKQYMSFSDEIVKNFSRVPCRFGQSSNICLTVSGSLQDSQTGWSSPYIKYEWVGRQWPSRSLLIITASRRERILLCWAVPTTG